MRRHLILLSLCAASTLLPAEGHAAESLGGASAPDAPAAAPASEQHAADRIAYRVVIDALEPVSDLVSQNVDLVRWQGFADMTDDLLDRLAREAIEQTREAAATLGFFNATVDVTIDRQAKPAVVTLSVKPGEPTRVADVEVTVTGAATADPTGRAVIAEIEKTWPLQRGSIWRQDTWTSAKQRAVAPLAAGPYADAKVVKSEARIDRPTNSAALSVEIDSGPAFHYGELDIRGLSRYPASIVQHFSTLEPGGRYSAAEVEQLVRRLSTSGYFSSVQAAIDTDPAHADRAPVQVAVIEGRTKKFEGGVGYSTDTQFRANVSYTDYDLDGKGLQLYADGRLEQKAQGASLRFVLPPTQTHWRDTYSAIFLRTDIENLVTETASVTARRVAVEERNQIAFGAGFFLDQQSPSGAETTSSHALVADVFRTWRRVDDLISPTRGYIVDVNVGASVPGASTRTFGRVVAHAGAWWPLSTQNEVSARMEAGAVLASSRDGIPSVFLFRTGGDTTVRGYAFESIGVKQGDATVGGRYVLVGSVEATHWLDAQWGVATFVDAGNATDSASDVTQLELGYGVGARVRTPIGPFRFDLAYGQQTHRVRLHFSVGLSF